MKQREIFIEALQKLEGTERDEFLKAACGDDVDLRNSVEELLAEHQKDASFFIDSPPPGLAAATELTAVTEQPGDTIGPYKLLQQIGEGGMGVVYMAEQTEPVERRVALKIIKPGMDTQQVIARFEAERQALAMMDHPNIAKVLDAGTTGTGRPYFVMELVKGMPVTQYCDEQHLAPRERLELFIPICQAVQHAHQKGIIHRDLKPSNILIAQYDNKAVPKIIDFGVAKATSHKLTEKTMFTQYGQIVGTLEYMSPEQARFNQLDVDTRSDIYSLGVLLYELLTGETPFDKQRLRSAAFDELLRIIREEEPPKPSTKLSSSELLASTAVNRKMEPRKLSLLVRGDLDWIVMKALEKDRNRRYETANAFATDVQRYLCDEPVTACPPSVGYKFRKFARRNKGGLAVAALVLFFLVLLGSGVGWVVRDREAREAAIAQERTNREAELNREREARRAKAAGQIELIFAEVDRLEGEQKWEEALLAARRAELVVASVETDEAMLKRVRDRLKDLEFIDRLEQLELGPGSVGEGRETTDEKKLGKDHDYAQAFRDFGVDVDQLTVESSIQRLRARPELAIPLGAALDNWAYLRRVHRMDETGRERLVAIANGVDPEPTRVLLRSPSTSERMAELSRLADSIDPRAYHPVTLNRLGAAVRGSEPNTQLEPAIRLLRRAQAVYPDNIRITVTLIQTLLMQKDYEEAIRFATALVALQPQNGYPWLALILQKWGKLNDAEAACRMSIEFARNSKEATNSYISLSRILLLQKKPDDAIAAGRKAVELSPGRDSYESLGGTLSELGRLDEAVEAYRKVVEIYPSSRTYKSLARALSAVNRLDEADAAFDKGIEIARKGIEREPSNAPFYGFLCELLLAREQWSEAIDTARKGIEVQKNDYFYYALGYSLSMLEQWDEAAPALREAIELDPTYASSYGSLGYVLHRQGKLDEAITAYKKAIELDSKEEDTVRRNLFTALFEQGWSLINNPDPKLRDPMRGIEEIKETFEVFPGSELALQYLGWTHYRLGDWRTSIETLEKSCKLQEGGTGDCGQWIVLALAHARLAVEDGLPEQEQEHHKQEARGWYVQADTQIDYVMGLDSRTVTQQAIVDFREEARKLIGAVSEQELAALRQKRWDRELAALSDEVQAKPDDPAPLTRRVRLYIRSGRFEQAVSDFDRLVQLAPADHWLWYHRGCLLAYLGREEEYREHCRAMLEQFADSQDLGVLDRTTKSALLLPGGAGGDVQRLAERAQKTQPTDPNNQWFALLMGMAEFRAGRPNEAVLWLEKCRAADLGALVAAAEAFLAMAHHQLGQEDKAAAALARCEQLIDRDLPEAGVEDLDAGTGGIENWLIAHIARREAEEMLKNDAEAQNDDLKQTN